MSLQVGFYIQDSQLTNFAVFNEVRRLGKVAIWRVFFLDPTGEVRHVIVESFDSEKLEVGSNSFMEKEKFWNNSDQKRQ